MDHTTLLDPSVIARFVRLNPRHWVDKPCLRVEVHGCDAGDFPLLFGIPFRLSCAFLYVTYSFVANT